MVFFTLFGTNVEEELHPVICGQFRSRFEAGLQQIADSLTKKVVTTLAQNNHEEVIMIRRCSEPNQPVRKLYDAQKYKYAPFVKRKSLPRRQAGVVHKSELENCQFLEQPEFHSD